MKTTLLVAALVSSVVFFQKKILHMDFDFEFFQKERFIETSSNSDWDLYQYQKTDSPMTTISNQSFSIIFHFIKITILPIGTIVILMWLIFGIDIINSRKK